MTLKEANKKLEELDNEYNYYLKEKEKLLSLILPKSTDIRFERVDGGKREDRLAKYVELEDEKKLNATLDYIQKRKENLINWIDRELEILGKYGETEQVIIQLKENTMIEDSKTKKMRPLMWEEIAQKSGYNKDHCRKIYRLYKKKRDIY